MKPVEPARIACDLTITHRQRPDPGLPLRQLGSSLVAIALFVGLCSNAVGADSPNSRKIEVQDPQYQMTAYTLEMPSGWKFGGAIVRDTRPCHGGGPQLKSTMQGPDGTSTVAFLPGANWNWTTDPLGFYSMVKVGCLPSNLQTAASFLVNIVVPILHPGGKVVSVQPLTPEGQRSLAEQLKQEQQGGERFTSAGFKPPKNLIDGARVRVEYTLNGKHIDEQLQSIIDCVELQGTAMPRQPVYMERRCRARNIYIVRAPKGQLDALLANPVLGNLTKSIQPTNDWIQQVSRDQNAQMSKMLAQSNVVMAGIRTASAQQFQQLVQRGKEFQKQQEDSFEQSQNNAIANENAQSAAAGKVENLSLGQATYTDPNTGQKILASTAYAHQWVSSDDSMVLGKDDPFDPNGTVEPVMTNPASITWTEATPDR
jgi:hypothetical protein